MLHYTTELSHSEGGMGYFLTGNWENGLMSSPLTNELD